MGEDLELGLELRRFSVRCPQGYGSFPVLSFDTYVSKSLTYQVIIWSPFSPRN